MEMDIVTSWDDMATLLNEQFGDSRDYHNALQQAVAAIYGMHDDSKTGCNAA